MIPRVIIKRLLTPGEAAKYIGISERQLEYLRSEGIINQTRLPNTKKRLYDIIDLDKLIENIKIKSI